ncbi:hypothetical protein SLE2022_354320 [Rubroshorea leprosula]
MLGLVTWTVRRSSASRTGRLSLKEVRPMEMRWKVGSFGFALRSTVTAVADAAPIKAEVQLHLAFLPMKSLPFAAFPLLAFRIGVRSSGVVWDFSSAFSGPR